MAYNRGEYTRYYFWLYGGFYSCYVKNKDSLRGLAKKINLHFTFIDKVEKGTAPISNNFIERVIEVYPDEEKTLKKEYLKENLPKVFNKDESIKILEDSEVLNLPVYGKASAGRGYLNMDKPDYYMPITKGDFSLNSFFVEITGNSMEPTLEDGEYALVDPNNTAYVKNKIYVVTYNDEGYIKRVEVKDKKKVITLKSDNPDYDDIDISEEMQESFKINGRVVEVISKKRVL